MLKRNFKYIIILLILYLVWAIVLPLLFKYNATNITDFIQKTSGYNIELVNPKLKLWFLPHAGFTADEVMILNKDDSKALSVENMYVNIKILPLIIGKCHILAFESSNIKANFSLDKNLYLGDYLIQKLEDSKIDCCIDRIKVNKYVISLFDKQTKTPIQLGGNNLYYKETRNNIIAKGENNLFIENSQSIVNFDIKIPKKQHIKSSKVNLLISNLNLKPLTNVLMCFDKDIKSIDGIINITCDNSKLQGSINNCRFIMKDPARSIVFPEHFAMNSEFVLKSNNLNIKSLMAHGNKVRLEVKGEIKKFTSPEPVFNLDINMPKSDVRQIALLLPPIVVPQFNVYRLKMYPFYGTAEANVKIKGKFPEPNLLGNILVSDAYMIKPIPNAKRATININCLGKKMNIDVNVPTAPYETVYVTGDIDAYGDNKADLRIRSSKSIDLATAEFVLNPLHEVLRFLLGPVPIMDIRGIGNIDIRIIGSKKDPHIWGDFNFRNTSASFNDVHHLLLEHATGFLNFNDQEAHFVNKTGTVKGQPFSIDGKCTLFGNIDFNVIGNNLPLQTLLDTLTDSPMLVPIKPMVPDIKQAKGNADLILNLTGKLPDINYIKFNENLFAKGKIKLKDNSLILNDIPVKRVRGDINFENMNVALNLNSILDDLSKINVTGKIKDGIANLVISSPRLNLREFTKDKFKELDDCLISLKATYKGKIDVIELDKIECHANILKLNKPVKNIKIMTGKLEIKDSKLRLTNVYGFIKQNPFNFDLKINHIDKDINKLKFDANFYIKNFDLRTLNYCKHSTLLPSNIRKELNNFKILYGNTDFHAKIRNNKINANMDLNNINCVYQIKKTPKSEPLPVPIKLINGQIVIKNNRIFLNKMNYLVDNMPVLIYGNIDNVLRKPKLNIHINSKLVQRTFDKYWNVDNIYPIKVKGDILLGSFISGTLDRINTRVDFKLEENSSIYYMGATVGDTENPITVNTDFDIINNNIIRLNQFQYNKLISSQNNKQNLFPLLTVNGGITYYNNNFYKFDNLIVKTQAPTDARIFNVIFRKPTIKHGQFTSDLKINGKSTSPKILGDLTINGIDMPFLSTTIKDLSFNFDDKNILIQSKGEVLSNNVICKAIVRNKFTTDYKVEKADIYLKHLDINTLMSQLKQLELKTFNENQTVGISKTNNSNINFLNSVLFDDLKIHADSVSVKNIRAKNLVAQCSLDDKMLLSVDDYSIDIADGKIHGGVKYNLLNNVLKLKINATNVNANELLIAVFDLPNQIYGKLTGTIDIVSNVLNDTTSKETLSGKAVFTVKDGRMPKLGSLEYLLRAGNVFKSGVTGMTMNSIIDLVSPLKTGEFSSIDGNIHINQGIADKIEIHSTGKDLNLFIKGKYNVVTQIADMTVLGQLSRKISTVFGTVGNLSLNSLFNKIPGVDLTENGQLVNELNKIPGIELSNKSYRKFIVEIFGDVNNDNNVRSFKWIN